MRMKQTKLQIFTNAFVSAVLALTAIDSMAAPLCSKVQSSTKSLTAPPTALSNIPDGYFQIGYESEYLFSESGKILRDFAPAEDLVPRKQWMTMTDEERINWLKAKFPHRPELPVDAGLELIADLPFEKPQQVIVDSTGNLEIVMNPVNSYREWERNVDQITKRYGPGSQQAMVSKPRIAGFGRSPEEASQFVPNQMGWFIFTNLHDMYVKLESGYRRFQADASKLTALSFDHPWLGPMTKIKRDKFEEVIVQNATLLGYDDASKRFVRKSDASFKYTGGPSYRPDIAGPHRFAWEIRNAHKDVEDLKAKVRRDIENHNGSLDHFAIFTKVPAFDTLAVFDSLPQRFQDGLKGIFPTKADPRFQYSPAERVSLETYRNFTYPLADHRALAEALQLFSPTSQSLVDLSGKAQAKYRLQLYTIVEEFNQGVINQQKAAAQIMGALGQFSVESGFAKAFDEASKKLNQNTKIGSLSRDRSKIKVFGRHQNLTIPKIKRAALLK
jgi:hypothetical protein